MRRDRWAGPPPAAAAIKEPRSSGGENNMGVLTPTMMTYSISNAGHHPILPESLQVHSLGVSLVTFSVMEEPDLPLQELWSEVLQVRH
jgi:hypothetical protein